MFLDPTALTHSSCCSHKAHAHTHKFGLYFDHRGQHQSHGQGQRFLLSQSHMEREGEGEREMQTHVSKRRLSEPGRGRVGHRIPLKLFPTSTNTSKTQFPTSTPPKPP